MASEKRIDVSVVVPVYNEETLITELYERLTNVMKQLSVDYEIVFTDDGSKDRTPAIIAQLHQRDKSVKLIKFSRNFGHHIAIAAGLDYAAGDAVILMDGDLQDPPEEIPKLYKKYKEGFDTVYAIRSKRVDPFLKKVASKVFYLVFRLVSNIQIIPKSGNFKIISRRVVDHFKKFSEKSRFTAALIIWTGFPCAGVETERDVRNKGCTKYNFLKSAKLGMDAVISFSSFPLRIASFVGFFIALLSFTIGSYMLIRKLFIGMPISGYASIIVSVYFLGGVQLIVIGLMGEYISRIYTEVQNRPLYIIESILE